jgi:hypothetical protein
MPDLPTWKSMGAIPGTSGPEATVTPPESKLLATRLYGGSSLFSLTGRLTYCRPLTRDIAASDLSSLELSAILTAGKPRILTDTAYGSITVPAPMFPGFRTYPENPRELSE